jgi:hypothetical protein
MIRTSGKGGLWAVTQVALMPCREEFDYEHEHRPLRRTEHEHDGIPGRLAQPEAKLRELTGSQASRADGICFPFRTRRQGS